MERIFWVKCPDCSGRFYADYGLRFTDVELICPFCQQSFKVADAKEIDDRWF
ncbi:MAG: hypothetical protein M1343_13550 [Chloroflexi bacterium]|nr:hypothetical protein [Chloroflexota bacterium]MDA8187688.1 hypothetical protein [Dehalococcoidales bacterium]